jgi:hypothetical protein
MGAEKSVAVGVTIILAHVTAAAGSEPDLPPRPARPVAESCQVERPSYSEIQEAVGKMREQRRLLITQHKRPAEELRAEIREQATIKDSSEDDAAGINRLT